MLPVAKLGFIYIYIYMYGKFFCPRYPGCVLFRYRRGIMCAPGAQDARDAGDAKDARDATQGR